ncbi:MAG: DUF3618 domain-containing protein [Actinomycetota bacterium]|nr:DUF3618 domain-containing protein [Actinomycetota bacterium]
MDEAARQGAAPVDGTAPVNDDERRVQDVEADIRQTREQLGETVEALAAKADVKAQARQRVAEIKETALHKKEELSTKAKANSPDGVSSAGRQAQAKAKENPLVVAAVAGLLVGFLLGRRRARRRRD